MAKPFANAPQHNGSVIDSYIIGLQIGRSIDAAGLQQMKYITIGQLKAAVTETLSAVFTFRGVYSSTVPGTPAVNDYFYCNETFTDSTQDIDDGTGTYSHTFYQNKLYAWNGTCWADITSLLPGNGIPAGGTTGQVLKKASGTNYDVEWSNEQDISGKADKAVPSAANNIALLSLIGNLVDSGISKDALQRVLALIPAQADPTTNQLADKEFVNSSIATNTATFRGSYNLVSDLSLSTSATQTQIAAAIATYLAGHSISADNNDYVFIQVPTSDSTPTEIREIDRYKFNGTEWSLEYPLNNSGFTAAQWAAINSNITSAKVASYDSHLANNDIHVTALQKSGWTNAIAGIQGTADAYDETEGYAKGDPCIYNNVVYLAKENIAAPAGAFNSTKWQKSDLKTLMDGVNTNASAISDISANIVDQTAGKSYTFSKYNFYGVGRDNNINTIIDFPFVTKNTNYSVSITGFQIYNVVTTTSNFGIADKTRNGFIIEYNSGSNRDYKTYWTIISNITITFA